MRNIAVAFTSGEDCNANVASLGVAVPSCGWILSISFGQNHLVEDLPTKLSGYNHSFFAMYDNENEQNIVHSFMHTYVIYICRLCFHITDMRTYHKIPRF